MAIGIYFHPESMSSDQYDDIIRRLEEAGAQNPPGRQYHACFGPPNQMMVFDVWDSPESFEKFGQTLMPILGEMGVNPGEPAIMPVHNIIVP
jgi:hypothetical protein